MWWVGRPANGRKPAEGEAASSASAPALKPQEERNHVQGLMSKAALEKQLRQLKKTADLPSSKQAPQPAAAASGLMAPKDMIGAGLAKFKHARDSSSDADDSDEWDSD